MNYTHYHQPSLLESAIDQLIKENPIFHLEKSHIPDITHIPSQSISFFPEPII